MARLSPVTLAASAQVRLRRLVPGATYREELHQLVVPLTDKERPAEPLLVAARSSWSRRPPSDGRTGARRRRLARGRTEATGSMPGA